MADIAQFISNDPLNDAAIARQARFAAILARDDSARAGAPLLTMVAIVSFTIAEDAQGGFIPSVVPPAERVIKVGDEFQISEYDLPRYAGRARRKSSP